jgi:hypothetical protein
MRKPVRTKRNPSGRHFRPPKEASAWMGLRLEPRPSVNSASMMGRPMKTVVRM